MISMKRMLGALGLMFAVMLGLAAPAAKAATLPTCTPGVNCLVFGDFNVYSLPLLDLQGGGDGVPGPGDPFFFSSTYGAIKNYTIVGINNGNCTATGNPPNMADCSYNTPSASSTNIFSTKTAEAGGVKDPGPAGPFAPEFAGDTTDTWDITTGALTQLIGGAGNPVTAFFAFNEDGATNQGQGLTGPSLLTWVKVTLADLTPGGNGTVDFYLCAGAGCQGNEPTTASIPAGNATEAQAEPWAYVHSAICTVGTNFVGFPDAAGNCPAGSTQKNQNNLGQNAAAFMVNSPALDAALASGDYDVMQVLWKMAHISGGGETAWIQSLDAPTVISEPSSLANFALALLALGFLMRRRAK